jgi:hypothetical protein
MLVTTPALGGAQKCIKSRRINAFISLEAGSPKGTLTLFVATATTMVQSS